MRSTKNRPAIDALDMPDPDHTKTAEYTTEQN
jgi:hypothetical protein